LVEGEMKDALLSKLEEKIKECLCRKADVLLKREKEEILAALCRANLEGAQAIHRRIEEAIEKHPLETGTNPVRLRIGMATYPEEALSKAELFRLARERLGG